MLCDFQIVAEKESGMMAGMRAMGLMESGKPQWCVTAGRAGLTRGLCGCGLTLVTAYWLSKIVEYTILTLLSTCLVYAPTCLASWPCNTHHLDAAAWWLVSLPTSTCS